MSAANPALPRLQVISIPEGTMAQIRHVAVKPVSVNSVCPVCGAYSLAPEGEMSALLAVCNVLVLKALEKLGNFLTRAERKRHGLLDGRPFYVAHTMWKPSDEIIDKALRNAWDVVPALLDVHGDYGVTSVQVTTMLDEYVHDLGVTGTAHTLEELQYRFTTRLGLPVYWRHVLPTDAELKHSLYPHEYDPAFEGLPAEAMAEDTRPVDETLVVVDEPVPPARVPDRVQGALRENGMAP